VVHVQQADGDVRTKYRVGAAAIELVPGTEAQLATAKGFGISSTPMALSVGYYSMQLLTIPESCHIVLWVKDDAQITSLRELIRENPNVCIAPKTRGDQS
jgi:hypothetical protein